MTPLIIGIGGYAGAGKDTAASYLVEKHGFEQRAFAAKVRQVAKLFGDNYRIQTSVCMAPSYNEVLRDAGGYEQAKRQHPAIREYLVKIGHGVRQILGDSLWRDQVLETIAEDDCVVISDCRYENEAQAVLDRDGIVVWLDRDGVVPANETEAQEGPKVRAMSSFIVHNIEDDRECMQDQLEQIVTSITLTRLVQRPLPQDDEPL
jgi:hypothetical protein